jgi:hypothetical protein
MIAMVFCVALIASATGLYVLHDERDPSRCPDGAGCRAPGAAAGAIGVRIDSGSSFGLVKPTAMTVGHDRLWVADSGGNSVTEFGWKAGSVPRIWASWQYGFSKPAAITASRTAVWIANSDSITEMNSADGRVIRVISGTPWLSKPCALVLFGYRLWIANDRSVAELNTVTGRLIAEFRNGRYRFDDADALAVSNHRLWVANSENGSVTEMDAVSGAWITTLRGKPYGFGRPVSETASRSRLWVASSASGSVSEIDTTTGHLVRVIKGPGFGLSAPSALSLDDGRLWVANAGNSSVTEIDAATGKLVRRLAGPRYKFASPSGIVAYRGRVWIMNSGAGSVTELTPPGARLPATASERAGALKVMQRQPAGRCREPEREGTEQQHGGDRRPARHAGGGEAERHRGLDRADAAGDRHDRADRVGGQEHYRDARERHVADADGAHRRGEAQDVGDGDQRGAADALDQLAALLGDVEQPRHDLAER